MLFGEWVVYCFFVFGCGYKLILCILVVGVENF